MPFGSIVRSIANLRRWRGAEVNALVNGLVDARAAEAASNVIGLVKSIQRGYSDILVSGNGGTATVTLPNAVTPEKTAVIEDTAGGFFGVLTYEITGPTTITVTNTNSNAGHWKIEWQAVEFY